MDNPMYKALLKWSLSQHDGTVPTGEGDISQLDPEKKAFLERVMK